MEIQENTIDMVSHPPHYTSGKVECIDAIESAIHAMQGERAFLTGQVIKYLWRWPLKNGVEDLRKARWYLDRLIKFVESVESKHDGTESEYNANAAKE